MGGRMKKVYVIGTADTKGTELRYARDLIAAQGVPTLIVNVGTQGGDEGVDVTAVEVAAAHPGGAAAVLGGTDRGAAVSAMAVALEAWLPVRDDIGCVLGLGGSGNTALVAQAARALPVGVPKIIVSTMAAGNVAGFVGPTDLALMHSVTDVAGLNAISCRVIGNAAHAAAGMAKWEVPEGEAEKPGIGLTMFGVTTPCITRLRALLEDTYEPFVFHATGTGGQSMEKLAESGLLRGLLDISTTEVADRLMGGILPCTDDRFGAVARTRIPYVGSTGALDMVNFGARDTVPAHYEGRNILVHNPQITLMRTTPEENRRMGAWIAERLSRCEGEVRFLLPLGGVSAVDAPGGPFHDPEADQALFAAIHAAWKPSPRRQLIELPYHINDPAFADEAARQFRAIAA